MKRAFSSTAGQLKQLNWTLHGTTIDVSWLIQQIERSIDEVPGLRARVVSAQRKPSPTPNGDDPYHGSVILLDKDGKRATSAHAYLNGYVKFSKEVTFKPVKLPPTPGTPVIPLEGVTTGKSGLISGSDQSTSKNGKNNRRALSTE